jgi:hypothetical protein
MIGAVRLRLTAFSLRFYQYPLILIFQNITRLTLQCFTDCFQLGKSDSLRLAVFQEGDVAIW